MALVASLGTAASASTTFTPAVHVAGTNQVACFVRNLGDSFEPVQITLRNQANEVVKTGDEVLPAGGYMGIATSEDILGANCVYEFGGDPSRVRGSLRLSEVVNGPVLLQAAAFEAPGGASTSVQTVTAPVRHISGSVASCVVQNLGAVSVEVLAEFVAEDGTSITSNTAFAVPNRLTTLQTTVSSALGGYCRFSFDGNPQQVRGYLMARDSVATGTRLLLPARPAEPLSGTHASTPALAGAPGDATTCVVQNLDSVTLDVSAELVDRSGHVLSASTKSVAPEHVVTVTGTTEEAEHAVCRFTFAEAGTAARGFISQFPAGIFTDTRVIEEAQGPGKGLVAREQTTNTDPLFTADRLLQCVVVNRTDLVVPVAVEIGNALTGATVAAGDILAPPGRASVGLSTAALVPAGFCRFRFSALPDRLHGAAMLTEMASERTVLQVAARGLGPQGTQTPSATASASATPTKTPTQRPTLTYTSTKTPTATYSATATRTPTPAFSPTATTSPVASATPTVAATPTATPTVEPLAVCLGDCNHDGSVTVDEVVAMVIAALGDLSVECPAGDRNGDGELTIDEILAAIESALHGC